MQTVIVNSAPCAINADGAYVPLANIKDVDVMRDTLVNELSDHATKLSEDLAKFKSSIGGEINAFADASAEEHGVAIRGRKGGFSLMSYDGLLKIVVDNDTLITVNEKVTIAREAVFACVRRWSEGANANLAEIIRHAFETDKQGHLSLPRLLALRSYKIDDPEWDAAMDALSQGLTAYGSKTYIRFYKRFSTVEKFSQIPLS